MSDLTGNVRKRVKQESPQRASSLGVATTPTTDEVLARIRLEMDEVMARARDVANSAVTSENEARAMGIPGPTGNSN